MWLNSDLSHDALQVHSKSKKGIQSPVSTSGPHSLFLFTHTSREITEEETTHISLEMKFCAPFLPEMANLSQSTQ